MGEKYIPSSKEIQKAETMMTEKEKMDSHKREKDVESRIRMIKNDKFGIDRDFLNEVPNNEYGLERLLEEWISSFATDMPWKKRTYTQRFVDQGYQYVVDASDPEKVKELDGLMLEAKEIAKTGNKELFRQKVREIWAAAGQIKH